MSIIMAGLSPHPPIIIPEIGGSDRSKVMKTINGLEELSREIEEHNPDLIITISPHGPVHNDVISILDQSEPEGDFGDFGYPEIKIKEETDLKFVTRLKERSRKEGIEVITLSTEQLMGYNFPAQLDHGVLVPLYYLKKAGVKAALIPLTMGLLEYRKLYDFGLVIQKTLDEMGINGVILASGDFSHRLKPGAPAGFNPRGREFDERIIDIIKKNKFEEILELDPQLVEKAGECGLRPLIIMLGALRGLKVKTDLKSYEGTFGVGYLVAGFYPEGKGVLDDE